MTAPTHASHAPVSLERSGPGSAILPTYVQGNLVSTSGMGAVRGLGRKRDSGATSRSRGVSSLRRDMRAFSATDTSEQSRALTAGQQARAASQGKLKARAVVRFP